MKKTRCALYSSIHKFIVKNAARRLGCSLKKVEELLVPLSKLAYQAYQRGDCFIQAEDFESRRIADQVLDVGYVKRDVYTGLSEFETHERYGFPHNSFWEFLSAKYLSENDEERRIFNSRSFHDFNERKAVTLFLFGLLNEKDDPLVEMAQEVMERSRFTAMHRQQQHRTCPPSHAILELMGELTEVPSPLMSAFAPLCPTRIEITRDCSSNCVMGLMKMLLLLRDKKIALSLSFDQPSLKNNLSIVCAMKASTCITSIELLRCNDLKACFTASGLEHNDTIQHVKVVGCRIAEGDELRIPRKLNSLELDECNAGVTQRLLNEFSKKPSISTLSIEYCSLNENIERMICSILKKAPLQNVALGSFPDGPMNQFLDPLTHLQTLQSMNIDMSDMSEDDVKNFTLILKRNHLETLNVHCPNSHSLYSDMKEHLGSLQDLSVFDFSGGDDWITLLSALPQELQRLELRVRIPAGNAWMAISTCIEQCKQLLELKIWIVYDDPPPHSTLKKLFDSIAGCVNLQLLDSGGLTIDDTMVSDLCNMLDSLQHLQELDLSGNLLSAEGIKHLARCLQHKNKLEIINLSGNPGRDDQTAVNEMEKCCHYLPYTACDY